MQRRQKGIGKKARILRDGPLKFQTGAKGYRFFNLDRVGKKVPFCELFGHSKAYFMTARRLEVSKRTQHPFYDSNTAGGDV